MLTEGVLAPSGVATVKLLARSSGHNHSCVDDVAWRSENYSFCVSTIGAEGNMDPPPSHRMDCDYAIHVWLCVSGSAPRRGPPCTHNVSQIKDQPQPCGAGAPFENRARPATLVSRPLFVEVCSSSRACAIHASHEFCPRSHRPLRK